MKISELFDAADKAMRINPQTPPPVMADRLVEITTYYGMLSDLVGDAETSRDDAEEAYKVKKLQRALDGLSDGLAVSKADMVAEGDAIEERKAFSSHRNRYKKLKNYQSKMETTMNTLIARLAWAKHEQRGLS